MISRPAWITQGIIGHPEFHAESLSEREGEKEKEREKELSIYVFLWIWLEPA